jgi:hypothetical protein
MLHPDSRIIGLRGPKRVGKNYTAGLIRGLLKPNHYVFGDLGFADALKEEVAQALNVSIEVLNGPLKETFRPILQWWGTEFRRNLYGENYWVDKLKAKVQRMETDMAERFRNIPLVLVVTDVRFPNEAELIKSLGGQLWNITRDGVGGGDQHPSETIMDSYTAYDAHLHSVLDATGVNAVSICYHLHQYGIQTK